MVAMDSGWVKRRLCVAAAAACALCESAWAAPVNFSDPYVELAAGAAAGSRLAFDGVEASLHSGPAANVGLGLARFLGPVDLRLDYATTDRETCRVICFAKQGVTSGSTMLSALYNFPLGPRWDAYAGAGTGVVKVEAEHQDIALPASENYSGSDSVFGWQFIGGARVHAFDGPIRLFLEYRYQKARNARIDGHSVEYHGSSLTFGARWTF
jgi:opacity protein-like surface antigen